MNNIKKLWEAFTSVIVAIVVIFALLLVGARIAGLNIYTILSGSMEPTYKTGALIYVKKVDYNELQEGDVITYMLSQDMVATHRIVGIVPDEEDSSVVRYRTKGDANNTEDATLVHCGNVIGVPVFSIPYLGYVTYYIQSPPGMYIAIAVACIIILIAFLPSLFEKNNNDESGKKDDEFNTLSENS